MKNLKNILVVAVLLATQLAWSYRDEDSREDRERDRIERIERERDRGERPPRYEEDDNSTITESIYIGRWTRDEWIDLDRLAGIISRNQGRELSHVEVIVQDSIRGSRVGLVINGMTTDQQEARYSPELHPSSRQRVLGYDIRSLQLRTNGQVYISEVRVVIDSQYSNNPGPFPPPQPRPPVGDRTIDRTVNVNMYGSDRLDLGQIIHLGQYKGWRVSAVTLDMEALSRRGVATAELLVNSFSQGRANVSSRRQTTFNITGENTIGRGFDSLMLYTQGDLRVNRVTLHLY